MAYKHFSGSDDSITKLYGERTAKTSCTYFLHHVTKTANILDVGCGPGVITADLAKIASEGHTIGIDNAPGIITQAQTAFPPSMVPNLTYAIGDANSLSFPDNYFDIVHAHQLLIHLPDPVATLREFHRVCKPGGFIAVRDSSPSIILSLKPDIPAIREHWALAVVTMEKMGSHPDAGAKLESWAKEAGLGSNGEKIVVSESPAWNPGHLGMVTGEKAKMAVQYGMATTEQLARWAEGWTEWEASDEKEFVFEAGEIVCWKGHDG